MPSPSLAVPAQAWQTADDGDTGSNPSSPMKAYRRMRSNTMLTSSKQKKGREGVKPLRVIARFNGEFGGKWDSFQETGNGDTRIYVKVTSTGLEYPVDSIINPSQGARSAVALICDRILDDLEENRDYGIFAYGAGGTGKTTALFSGEDADLGVAYGTLRMLVAKQRSLAARSEATAILSVNFFELHEGDKIRDLLNPDNEDAMVANLQPNPRQIKFHGLTDEPIMDEDNGTNVIFDALNRRSAPECPTCPHTVLRFTMMYSTEHKREESSIYLTEINSERKDSFRKMLQLIADGDIGETSFNCTLTRMIIPKLLDYGHAHQCFIIACMGSKMIDRADTLQTLKSVRNAYELRVKAAMPQLNTDGRMGMSSPIMLRIGDGSSSDVVLPVNSSPQMMSELMMSGQIARGGSSHQTEIRCRQTEGKLEALRNQVRRLEEDITLKKNQVETESKRRLLADQKFQDEANARNLLEQRNQALMNINKESEDKFFRSETKIRELRQENATLSQLLVQERSSLKHAMVTGKVAEEELADLTANLTALVTEPGERRLQDVLDDIKRLIKLPVPEENNTERQRSPNRPAARKRSLSHEGVPNGDGARKRTSSPIARTSSNTATTVTRMSSVGNNSANYSTPKSRSALSGTFNSVKSSGSRRMRSPRRQRSMEHSSPLTNTSPGVVRTRSRERRSAGVEHT